jgi:hypothetical protein
MKEEDALKVIGEALTTIKCVLDDDVSWFERPLALARGYYAPEEFDFVDAVEEPTVEAAWESLVRTLPTTELLHMFGAGGHPGGAWADDIDAYDLPDGSRLYTWQTDIADVGQQGTFLIAVGPASVQASDERVVEGALTGRYSLASSALSGTLSDLRTVLPRPRLITILIGAADLYSYDVYDVLADQVELEEETAGESEEAWKARFMTAFLASVTNP